MGMRCFCAYAQNTPAKSSFYFVKIINFYAFPTGTDMVLVRNSGASKNTEKQS